ncbi:peptide deformylase [Hydrogenobacter thermophilus TK-6]|uniref:Peptide deformylase n=1 Tax=Hydrogenobacter thermophilus (strain DSM 6534 / IAM 12695 / TK-6) TaxID=608538 RepID=D3DGH7_HYDTT|nr:peptide deformylase [Hydrogenobacter thermophilus]ADO44864.1 peptide deformylase [Hydrogenobacter thermophilus TK-6]BAI68929.1 peptide deformylase [Hydrogenobacter thermophilus TK-6]
MRRLEILKYPDERLKIPSKEVSDFGKFFSEFLESLVFTMRSSPGCVGIAAPQVNVHKRVIVVDTSISKHKENKLSHGLLVLVNPIILQREGEIVIREGCLSVPDYTGNVKRHYWIKVSALDVKGNPVEFETEGFEAVVIQHEIDHLDGKVFLERLVSPKELFKRKVYR